MKKKNRTIYIVSGIILILIIGIFIREKFKDEILSVTTSKASFNAVTEYVSASGKIHPELEVKISSDVSGEIIDIGVQEGDSVPLGKVLLKIKPDNYISILERAESGMNSTKAQVAQSKARLAQAQANHIKNTQSHQRNKILYEQKVISDAEFETSKATFDVSEQELESARQSVNAAEFEVKSSEAAVKEAKENLKKTTLMAPMSGIISKMNVEKGERVVGTLQMAGTELLRIANLNNMEVRVNVNENDIIRISLGDTAIIDVDSYTHQKIKFKGLVTSISNSANETLNLDQVTDFEVKIRILQSSYKQLLNKDKPHLSPFRPGMTASVEIKTEEKNAVLTVPISSVISRKVSELYEEKTTDTKTEKDETESKVAVAVTNGNKEEEEPKEIVFIYSKDSVKVREVKTGISDDKNIEIISGLSENDEVVSGPYHAISKLLKDGTPVQKKDPAIKGKSKRGVSVSFGS